MGGNSLYAAHYGKLFSQRLGLSTSFRMFSATASRRSMATIPNSAIRGQIMVLDHTWEERSLIVVGSSSARPCDVKERSRKASACIPNNDDVTVALACERALELFTPSTSASTLATTAGWGGGSYDESVVAQYQIVGGPQRTTSAQDANADPD